MPRAHERERTVHVAELGLEVRVQGAPYAAVAPILRALHGEKARHVDIAAGLGEPAVVAFIAARIVDPRLTVEDVRSLSIDARGALLIAIQQAHPETRRRLRAAIDGTRGA